MKIGDLKIIHILLVAAFILWAWFFFRMEQTRYQMQFDQWRQQATQAINQLNERVQKLEKK
jgi:hypothetical protein